MLDSSGRAPLTTGQVAARVGVSTTTILRYVNDGTLHATRTAGGYRRYPWGGPHGVKALLDKLGITSERDWQTAVTENLASLNDIVAELATAAATATLADPQWSALARDTLRAHSAALGYQ